MDKSVKLNIKALAAMKNLSIAELANEIGLSPDHLNKVRCAKVQMTATDLMALAEYTGVNPFNIQYKDY